MSPTPGTSRLMVLGAALLFSTGGTVIKLASVSGWAVAGWRSVIAALLLLAVVPEARRGWNVRVFGVSVLYAATLLLFAVANKLTTAAHAIFLQDTAPLYVLLFAPRLLGERWRPRDLWVIGAIAFGMAMLLWDRGTATAVATDPALGNVLAAMAGLTWAGTLMGLRGLARQAGPGEDPAIASAALGSVLSGIVGLTMAEPPAAFSGQDWAVLLYLGIFQVAGAYILMTRGMRQVPALQVSLLLMIEPVSSAMLAAVVHGEWLSPVALLGCLVILASMAVQVLPYRNGDLAGEELPPAV